MNRFIEIDKMSISVKNIIAFYPHRTTAAQQTVIRVSGDLSSLVVSQPYETVKSMIEKELEK